MRRSPNASNRLPWMLAVLAVAVAAIVAFDPDPVSRALVVLATGACAAGVVAWTHRRTTGAIAEIERWLGGLGDGDLGKETPAAGVDELAGLARALEDARGHIALRMQTFETQRDQLGEHLARVEERLRDPVAEARRDRIAKLDTLRARLYLGVEAVDASLLDLAIDQAVLALDPAVAARLVPGLPVELTIVVDGETVRPGGAVAIAPGRGTTASLVEWVFRFEVALEPPLIPLALRRALELRGAERVRPTRDRPVTATFLSPIDAYPATVVDLSRTGMGLLVPIDPARMGALDGASFVRLTFPMLGFVAILPVVLCNVRALPDGYRLGLRFENASRDELDKVAAWLHSAASERATA
jgi:hypothetical protein